MANQIKKGVNMWSFPDDYTIRQRIKASKDLGFDGIELCLQLKGEFSLESTEEEVREIKRYADELQVPINSINSGLFFQFSVTSSKPEIREGAKNLIKKQLDFAQILGCDAILACPGAVWVDFQPNEVAPDVSEIVYFAGEEIIDYDVAYERAVAAFRELAPYAESKGVVIAVENIWNFFLLSPLEMRNFIDEIGSPWVQAYVDVGNMMLFGFPQHWIKILGKRVKKIHLKDFRRGTAKLGGFVDLLSGDVDWVAVVDELEKIGYDGWVNAEMTPVYKKYPEQMAVNTSAAMDKILRRV